MWRRAVGLAVIALALMACGSSGGGESDGSRISGTVRIEYGSGDFSSDWVLDHVDGPGDVDRLLDPSGTPACPEFLPDADLLDAQVEVKDSSDELVGVGRLEGDGTWTREGDTLACEVAFQVDDDLGTSEFFTLEVEGGGSETIRADDLGEPIVLTVRGASA